MVQLVAVALVLVACQPATDAELVTLAGRALAGPVCPVVTDPPEPGCDDRPVADALIVVTDPAGNQVAQASTDAEGRFSVELPAGSYRLVPQPVPGVMGTAAPSSVTLQVGEAPEPVLVAYDTGIR